MVDNIEHHVEESGKYTGTARAELVKAQEYQSKARKVHKIRRHKKNKQTRIWMISSSILKCTSSRQSPCILYRHTSVEVFHLLIFINPFSVQLRFRFYLQISTGLFDWVFCFVLFILRELLQGKTLCTYWMLTLKWEIILAEA